MRAIFFSELEPVEDIVRQCDACLDNVFFDTTSSIDINQPYSLNPFSSIKIGEDYFIIITTTAIALVNQESIDFLNQFTQPRDLNSINSIIVTKFIENGFLNNQTIKPIEDIDKLTAWLQLTNQCNLRCGYCFVSQHSSSMSLEIGKKSIDSLVQIAKKEGIQKLKLKYAGGEPLSNFTTLQAIHHYATTQEITINASLLTNGTLLNKTILKWLKQNNIRLVISLDAIEESQRLYPNGKDSSFTVRQNIQLAIDYGITPSITITINSQNIEKIPKLLEWVLSKELPFSINFDKSDQVVESDKIIQGMLKAFKVIENNPPKQSLLHSLLDMTNLSQPHLRSCSVGQNYLIFDTNGNISQCPMQITKPVSSINSNTILADIQSPNNPIKNPSVDEIEECKSCQWRYWCGGGCAVMSRGEKSPYCEVYQRLFPEVLRLEGMRFL